MAGGCLPAMPRYFRSDGYSSIALMPPSVSISASIRAAVSPAGCQQISAPVSSDSFCARSDAMVFSASAVILARTSSGVSLWTNRPFQSEVFRSGAISATVGASGVRLMRSSPIEARTLMSSRQGRMSCSVVLMTSTSPYASVLQSSASKAASEANAKPFSSASAKVTLVGISGAPKWPRATSFSWACAARPSMSS